jgi:hypothetical protein
MDPRRELSEIFKHYDRFAQSMGEEVVWWEKDVVSSTTDNVYDEGPNQVYYAPKRVTVIQLDQSEGPEISTHDGRHTTNTIRFGVTAQALRESGITNTHGQAQQHLNDVIEWDGRYFAISSYQIRGRVRGDVVIGVTAVETMEFEEEVFDTTPPTTPPGEPTVY